MGVKGVLGWDGMGRPGTWGYDRMMGDLWWDGEMEGHGGIWGEMWRFGGWRHWHRWSRLGETGSDGESGVGEGSMEERGKGDNGETGDSEVLGVTRTPGVGQGCLFRMTGI